MTDTRYRRNPHLLMQWGDDKRIDALNIMTGRHYRLDPTVISLLSNLSQPRTLAELATEIPSLTKQLPGLLDKLHAADLIQIEASESTDSSDHLWSSYELAMHIQASGIVTISHPGRSAPSARKEIVATRRISLASLPLDIPSSRGLSVSEALHRRQSIRHYSEDAITLSELSVFLTTSAQVINFIGPEHNQTTHRPSPSGGARHSLELYVLCRNVTDLSPAVYYYDPFNNELAELEQWNAGLDDLLYRLVCAPAMLTRPPDVAIYITSVVGRVFCKYKGNGLALIYRDTGCLLQSMYLVATDLALAPCAIAMMDQLSLPGFVHARPLEEIHVASFILGRPA
ncbi:MAG: SagB family peptide dehydrogenase [Ktedonobacteraceae bacterium]